MVGYYSLSAASVLRAATTGKVRRNMPEPVPAVLIGRLAVDRAWHGRGLGADLLRDAVLRIVAAAGTVGVRAILVHAISDEAKAFYEKHGFRASPLEPMTLMITIDGSAADDGLAISTAIFALDYPARVLLAVLRWWRYRAGCLAFAPSILGGNSARCALAFRRADGTQTECGPGRIDPPLRRARSAKGRSARRYPVLPIY